MISRILRGRPGVPLAFAGALLPFLGWFCSKPEQGVDPARREQVITTILRECVRPCDEASGGCSAYPPYDVMRTRLSCRDPREFATAGRCGDGKRFLFYGTGFTGSTWYFAEDGRFLSYSYESDAGHSPCYGFSFTPAPMVCDSARTEEVICGDTNAAPLGDEARVRELFHLIGNLILREH